MNVSVWRHVKVPTAPSGSPQSRRSVARSLTSFQTWQEILQRDRLVAMRAEPTRPEPTAEDAAVLAPLLAQVAGLALRAAVHGRRARAAARKGGHGCGVPSTPQRLTAGSRAGLLATDRLEGAPTARAGDRLAELLVLKKRQFGDDVGTTRRLVWVGESYRDFAYSR